MPFRPAFAAYASVYSPPAPTSFPRKPTNVPPVGAVRRYQRPGQHGGCAPACHVPCSHASSRNPPTPALVTMTVLYSPARRATLLCSDNRESVLVSPLSFSTPSNRHSCASQPDSAAAQAVSAAIDGVRRQAVMDAVNSLAAALKASLQPTVDSVLSADWLPCRCASCLPPGRIVCPVLTVPLVAAACVLVVLPHTRRTTCPVRILGPSARHATPPTGCRIVSSGLGTRAGCSPRTVP